MFEIFSFVKYKDKIVKDMETISEKRGLKLTLVDSYVFDHYCRNEWLKDIFAVILCIIVFIILIVVR